MWQAHLSDIGTKLTRGFDRCANRALHLWIQSFDEVFLRNSDPQPLQHVSIETDIGDRLVDRGGVQRIVPGHEREDRSKIGNFSGQRTDRIKR